MSLSIDRASLFSMIYGIYQDSRKEFNWPDDTDMSRSDKCHTLTRDLMLGLQAEGFPVRRELHVDNSDRWHHIIVHNDGIPSKEDIVTDLNPWRFGASEDWFGPLHGDRAGVMNILVHAGAGPRYVALRGLSTISLPHTEALLPPNLSLK